MARNDYVCTFKNLNVSYGAENVLTGINGYLSAGEALALIGPTVQVKQHCYEPY